MFYFQNLIPVGFLFLKITFAPRFAHEKRERVLVGAKSTCSPAELKKKKYKDRNLCSIPSSLFTMVFRALHKMQGAIPLFTSSFFSSEQVTQNV